MKSFHAGFFSIFRGAGLLWNFGRLRLYAIIPFIIGLVMLCLGIRWGVHHLAKIIEYLLMNVMVLSGAYLGIAYYVGIILAWPAFLIATVYGVFVATKLVASPFNSLLAERALIELKVIQNEPFHLWRWVLLAIRMLFVSILKSVVFLLIGIVLFVLSFVPGLNLLAALGFFLIVAFDSVDYSFEALQFGFQRRFWFFRDHFAAFVGMALSLSLVFFIPGLNFLLFPAAVAGGSDLVRRLQQQQG